jgi:hypothetical protein
MIGDERSPVVVLHPLEPIDRLGFKVIAPRVPPALLKPVDVEWWVPVFDVVDGDAMPPVLDNLDAKLLRGRGERIALTGAVNAGQSSNRHSYLRQPKPPPAEFTQGPRAEHPGGAFGDPELVRDLFVRRLLPCPKQPDDLALAVR